MKIDPAAFDLNDPLLDASCEVFALEDYLASMEEQIGHIQTSQRLKLDVYIKKEKLTSDDPEWHVAIQEYYHWVDFLLPRFFRGPYLVTLYAVYESIVTEIMTLMQANAPKNPSFAEYKKRLNFLKRAKKYYREVLKVNLCSEQQTWDRLLTLMEFRHAIAHGNGRFDVLRPNKKKVIKELVSRVKGVNIHSGYIVFDSAFVSETATLVIAELNNLIERQREACRPRKIV
jgi:hypothetical protein